MLDTDEMYWRFLIGFLSESIYFSTSGLVGSLHSIRRIIDSCPEQSHLIARLYSSI